MCLLLDDCSFVGNISVFGLSITIEEESKEVVVVMDSGVGESGRDDEIPNEAGLVIDGGVKADAAPTIIATLSALSDEA